MSPAHAGHQYVDVGRRRIRLWVDLTLPAANLGAPRRPRPPARRPRRGPSSPQDAILAWALSRAKRFLGSASKGDVRQTDEGRQDRPVISGGRGARALTFVGGKLRQETPLVSDIASPSWTTVSVAPSFPSCTSPRSAASRGPGTGPAGTSRSAASAASRGPGTGPADRAPGRRRGPAGRGAGVEGGAEAAGSRIIEHEITL